MKNMKSVDTFSQRSGSICEVSKKHEAFVISAVKSRMEKTLLQRLEKEGQRNLKDLISQPCASVIQLKEHIETYAPELKTVFFRHLTDVVESL